jgi:hypothetical protein
VVVAADPGFPAEPAWKNEGGHLSKGTRDSDGSTPRTAS